MGSALPGFAWVMAPFAAFYMPFYGLVMLNQMLGAGKRPGLEGPRLSKNPSPSRPRSPSS